MFNDVVFNGLDDISKMLEPFTYSINDIVAGMPDEISIDFFDIHKLIALNPTSSVGSGIYIEKLISIGLSKQGNIKLDNLSDVQSFYSLKVDDNLILNLELGELSGCITIFKKSNGYSDKEMKQMVDKNILDGVKTGMSSPSQSDKKSANELAELFDIKNVNNERSTKGKRNLLIKDFENIINDNKICIKDVDFSKRVGKWIRLFLSNGNLGAIKNLCKLKIVSHKKHAIYSIEGEVDV